MGIKSLHDGTRDPVHAVKTAEVTSDRRSLGDGEARRRSSLKEMLLAFNLPRLTIPVLLLWLILWGSTAQFMTFRNWENIGVQSAILGTLAAGSSIVLITAEIDLSVGAVEGLTAVVAGLLIVTDGIWWPIGILVTLIVGSLTGFVNGVFTTKLGIPSFVTTLAMMGLVGGLSLQLTGGNTLSGFPHAYQTIGQSRIFGLAAPVIIVIVLMAIVGLGLRHTRFGFNLYVVGDNADAARLVHISVSRIKVFAFVLSGFVAALAGIMASSELDAANGTFGSDQLLNAIAAAVIGGTALTGGIGNMRGTAVGVLMIVTINDGLGILNVSPYVQQIVVGSIILLAVGASSLTKIGYGMIGNRMLLRGRQGSLNR